MYILNNSDYWLRFTYENAEGELYYELVNGRLCIKFCINGSNELKYKLRNKLREAINKVYSSQYKIVASGRLGTFMTACQIEHDFTDSEKFDDSARIFWDIGQRLKEVLEGIS